MSDLKTEETIAIPPAIVSQTEKTFQPNLTKYVNPCLIFLESLGYKEGDTVYLRAIKADGAHKFDFTYPEIPRTKLGRLQGDNGIYCVVNGGGHSDKDVSSGRAIFFEHDDLPKDVQLALWQTLGLPEPTIQVDTGGRSIHSYWVFDTPIPIADWKLLQSDLLDFADADRSIKNLSRIMRLPGYPHQKTKELATIASLSGRRYSFEQLRAIVSSPASQPTPLKPEPKEIPKPQRVPYAAIVPLEKCISKEHRSLISTGVPEGGRNVTGSSLSRDLVGTANHLNSEGIPYEGDPRGLFEEYCDRCTPPLEGRERETIWRSAIKSNPTPSLTEEMIQNCVAAWQRSQIPKAGKQATGNPNDRDQDENDKPPDKLPDILLTNDPLPTGGTCQEEIKSEVIAASNPHLSGESQVKVENVRRFVRRDKTFPNKDLTPFVRSVGTISKNNKYWTTNNTLVEVLTTESDRAQIQVAGEKQTRWVALAELQEAEEW